MASSPIAQESRTASRSWTLPLAVVLVLGVALRLALAMRMPVGYDEIFDVALGLLRTRGGRGAGSD